MRIQNSIKNMVFGIAGQVISALMGFIVRTVFVYTLGVEYLGVNGLFTSILIMLSLANLGFDTAIIYSLYKPLAENDIKKIKALLNLYQKAYKIIGVIVLVIGLTLLPFLPFIMNGETSVNHFNIIYLLFLSNSVISYYFVYKQSIIIADQRQHIISKIHSIFIVCSNIIQIFILFFTGNYIGMLSVQIAFRIFENIYISRKANELYPFLKVKNNAKLSAIERKEFFENLYSQMLYKISGVVINGTDSIVISLFIGVASVGIYSNYVLIITTLTAFLSYIFYSITASVGNLVVKETKEKMFLIFRVQSLANFWIYGICAIGLWNTVNPFITLWLGEEYIFDKFIVFAIIFNFFTAGMQNASTTFRETTGLFKKGKYRPVIAALINIIVSVVLAKTIGIAGVFWGTIISRICTYFWYDPYVIFKYIFKRSVKFYFIRYLGFLALVTACASIIHYIGTIFNSGTVMTLILMGGLSIIIPNTIFWLFVRKTDEFQYLSRVMRTVFNKTHSKQYTNRAFNS